MPVCSAKMAADGKPARDRTGILALIMHIPISQLHAQWPRCLHFNMSLNSQRFLQFHPTVILVAYVNSCFIIIRQSAFPVSISSRIAKHIMRKKTHIS
jgi:hypothetical protein